jgi:hypothetical protein
LPAHQKKPIAGAPSLCIGDSKNTDNAPARCAGGNIFHNSKKNIGLDLNRDRDMLIAVEMLHRVHGRGRHLGLLCVHGVALAKGSIALMRGLRG